MRCCNNKCLVVLSVDAKCSHVQKHFFILDNLFTQLGGRTKEQEQKDDRWHRVERSTGKFMRRFRLPENAKMDQVKAAMENGVLTVTVPKEEDKKPQVKSIQISAQIFNWLLLSLIPNKCVLFCLYCMLFHVCVYAVCCALCHL